MKIACTRSHTLLSSLLLLCPHPSFAAYSLLREYSGKTFFDRWNFYGDVDNTTWGNVTYVDRPTAFSQNLNLAYVNDAGNAIIRVDNTTTIEPAPLVHRNSVRITSQDTYGVGTIIMIDTLHIPYGCSVWPSFWTYGTILPWPNSGEIDIIEAINNMPNNQVALHTLGGCFQTTNPAPVQWGNTLQTDCSTGAGCVVAQGNGSFGPGFASSGGGVFAMQFDVAGIWVWFWLRKDIPENILLSTSTSKVDPSQWGTPSAAYPATACDITKYFGEQQLVLLTTLCGVWAGVPSIYSATCKTPTNSCVNDNVVGDGSNYDHAYWEVQWVRAYLVDTQALPTSSSASAVGGSATVTTAGASTSTTASAEGVDGTPGTHANQPSSSPSGGVMGHGRGEVWIGGMLLLGMAAWLSL